MRSLPDKPGVYLFKDKRGEILYVGKAKSLRKRVASYFRRPADVKTSILLSRLYDIDYITAASELDALILEDELIKQYKPRYNISLRDDKAYPFLKLTVNEQWPRLFLVRKKEKDGALYFGRYEGGMVREVIRLVKKLFPIRWCRESPLKTREQPCLYYRIGSCSGPCVGKISRESYLAIVQGIISLLEGRIDEAVKKLEDEMEKASRGQDFERAAYLRNRLKLLRKMMEGKGLAKAPALHRMAGVEVLQKELRLSRPPLRIEAFDISNIGASNMVGSMVTFYGGAPLKNDYRRFKIKGVAGKPNDVAAIHEVVKRRYTGSLSKKLPRPDLIMVDGGISQVNAGKKGLSGSGIEKTPIVGLAKREEEIYFPGKSLPLHLAKDSSALQLLQRVRDEAHRFALRYHRERRSRNFMV